ncbi:hypothetical protein [Pseudomonas canadensis]|uniref:hypothetical protein n=1 Tax=Pseudomonas canadensis TaxID=915099 RepID=UPI003BA21039
MGVVFVGRTPWRYLPWEIFPKTQPFGPMFIGFRRVAKDGVFGWLFQAQGLDIKGLERFLCGIPGFDAEKVQRFA